MASEAGILESISEKKVQDETGDLRCAQIHNPPEYINKAPEVLKEHSNESEIKGGLTDSAALQSSEMIGQYPPHEAVTAKSESSTLSESSKDQSSHSVTVGIIDSSEGEVFVEAPPRVQIHLEDICNSSNAGIYRENPINKEKEKLESGNMLLKDQKDELEEEKDVTVPKNSSSEANFTDASLHTAAVTDVPLKEKMQRNDFGNDNPVKKSDEHIFESTGANQNTEKADVLGKEKTSTGIHENSVVDQYRDLETLGDKVDDKQLEKSIDLEHEKQDFEAIKDKKKSETQESTENLSVNPERLPLPEDLGETGLQKEDEENDRFDDLSGPLSEEQCDKDDRRVSMENCHEKEDVIGIVRSNETSRSQNIASVEDKEEKVEESSFLASEEKILESLDTTEKVSEIQYGKTSVDASVKELSNLKLSAEESALEHEMSSDKANKVCFKEQEPIQRARVITIETETCKEETHTEMDPCKCTSQMKKEPEESNFIEDSMADKDVECSGSVSTEKIPGAIYASKIIENEDLDECKQDGQMDASISTKTEVPGIQNDQVTIMTHKETYAVLYEENDLQANDPMDAGDDLKKGENLNEQAKAKSEEEKFEEVCRVVEALDTRETVATAISMDEPHVVSAEDIIQDQETTHSRNEKENENQEEEETNYGNIDSSASSLLTDEIQLLNEEKKAQKFEEISEVVLDKDHCHEKALNQDYLKAQTTVYDMLEVSKTQNEEGSQELKDKDGINIDKIERVFEEKYVEAIAETKPSNRIKASEKGHAQEAVSVDSKEHADETIHDGTLGPEQIKDETDGAKLETDSIVGSKEVEVTEGIANTEKENIDSKSPMNIEEIPKDDEAMCGNIEKVAAELIHEHQTIMTNDLSETGIPIEKNDNLEENVGDLPVAHKLDETIQVCENMDHIKQELEPENVEKYSKSAARHQSQMTMADTEATDLDSSGDGVSMDKTLSASSTIQASIVGNSQKVTDPEEAEEKICKKVNENIGHDKHLGESLGEEAQKDIHKKIEDNKRMEEIIPGDEQRDKTKAGMFSNEEQMEGKKLNKGDELKQGKETNEAVVNREICLEENPIIDASEDVQKEEKWGNKLEKPSDEISVKIIMAQDSASNKDDLEKKSSPKEKEESSQEKGEVGVTLEQTIERLHTEDPNNKPHCKDEKTSSIIGKNGDAKPAGVKDEARNDSSVNELKQGKETNETIVNREIYLEENPIVDAPENVQDDDKWGNKLEKPSDEISVKIIMAQDSAFNKEDLEKKGSPEKKEESFRENEEAGVTLEQTVDKLDAEDPSHKPHDKDEKTSSIIGQNSDAEPARVKDEARNGSSVNELKQRKETDEAVVTRDICLEENPIVDAPENFQEDDKWGNKLEKPFDEISMKVIMAQDNASNKDVEKKDSPEEKEESSQEKDEAAVTLQQTVNRLDTEDQSHKPHGKDEKTFGITGQNSNAEHTRVRDEAQNDSHVDQIKQEKETNEAAVNREICLEENPTVNAPKNVQEDDKWGSKLEKSSDEISVKIMAQDSASNKEDIEKKSPSEEKEESSQKKGEAGVTLKQIVDRLDTEDPSHKPHDKDEKISSIIGQNDDAEPARVKDEARKDTSVDELKQGKETNEVVVNKEICLEESPIVDASENIQENDKWGNKLEKSSNEISMKIIMAQDSAPNKEDLEKKDSPKEKEESSQEKGEAPVTLEQTIDKLDTEDQSHKPDDKDEKVFETINTNGDNETAKSMNEEFLEKNIKDALDSHSLATEEIHDPAGEKLESETIIESEEQIHHTTSNKDNIDTDICKEKADSNRLDFISESVPEDQSGESDTPTVDNLTDDDKLKIPATGDLNDDHENAKVKYESILEKSMDAISDSHALVLEKTYGRVGEKYKALNSMSEEQIQATNTEENKQVAVYNENIDIKRFEIVVKSGPKDQSPDKMTGKIAKTLDMINDKVNPLSNSQASIEHTLQEEENPTVYAETTGVHKSTEHSISEEDKSSDSKSSGSSLDRSAESTILKEETNNDAILGSSLKHNVIENACELESEGKQHEVPEEKETSDTVLEESPSMTSGALERSVENLNGKQMIWEKEASENKDSLRTECEFVEEGFQEDKEETKIVDQAAESAYSDKNNETNEVNDSTKVGITNKEVETSDDDKSHEASCSGKEYIIIKLQSEDNENANIKDEESTNNSINDTPVTSALGSEAASASLHRGQRESITREEEMIRNMKLDQEAASDLTSVEQHLEVIIKTNLANIDILEEDKCNLVAQYIESEVVNAKDEECISKTDDLPTIPAPAKEVRWEIEEKHEKYLNYEEQIHERSITDNTMDNETLEEDKNIEEVERALVRMSEEQSHEGTTRTGIIENEKLEVALSASQNFDEEKTSKIAFLSEGNEHSCEAGKVRKKATCMLLKEAKSIVEAASGTSLQSEVGADELNEDQTSVFNRKFESLDPEKNQEEETPTRERASDACIGAPHNLVSVEPTMDARAENMVDLTIEEWKAAKIMDKEVKDSVLAYHENSETTAETKSSKNGPKDDALTVKKNSVEQNMQKDVYWIGSEDHIHDATEDHETTKCVARENRNKEKMEDRKMLQSKKMEDEKQKERKEIQEDMEISETIYPSKCNNESLEEKGTLNKGSEKEILEVVEPEKALIAFKIMEESEFIDRFVSNKEEPEVERSLQAKEMKDEKQEEENKIQSKEKISEADDTSKCNKESSEEKRISERGAKKQKADDVELENLQNVVPEELEVAYQTENINSDGQEKEVTDDSLKADFHKKEDQALEDIVIELDVVDHSNEPKHDSDATEGVLEQEKILEVVNFSATKKDQIKMFGSSSIKSDLVEEIKDVEPSGSHLQKESVEPKALETEEKFESISFEEEPKKNEKLGVGSQNDANEAIQVEEVSNMVFDRLPIAGSSEKTETKITSEDVEAPDVAHVTDKPFHEQIQGDKNKTEIKKPETKWELEETDTIVNEILNDKVKEPGYMPSKKNHAKMELPEKMDTTSPVDEEEPTKNAEFSSIKASSSEIMQDVGENLDKESVPKESTQIDAKTKAMGLEFTNNMMNDEEGPIEIEKFEHISTNSVSVDRTCNKNSITSDANDKGEEAIDQEDREKLEEASNSVSDEKVNEWDDSLAAFIEDKDNSQNTPIKQATEVATSAEEKEMIWQTEGETHEKVRDFGNSENEENQQTNQDDLPVSRFLMNRIMQEEGDKLAEACDVKCEDQLQVNIHDQKNDVNILKQERNSDSLSVEQVKYDTSRSEGKVEDLIKNDGSSDLVQQNHDLKKDTENATLKDDESPDRNLLDTSLTLTAGEDVKDELSHLFDKELTNAVSDNNMEVVSAEGHSPESKVDVEELKKLDNIIPIPAPEMITESIIQNDDESLKKNSDVATVIKAFEEETLKKEGGKESPEISQDIAENDQASYAIPEEQTPSVAEPVGNAKGEIQIKETVSNGDQPEKSFQSSSIENSILGEALETQSGGIKVKTGKENQDGTAESQMKDVKNNLSEELKVSDPHKVQQTEPIVEHSEETIQTGERILAERSPTVSADEKHAKEIADAHMKEEKNGEEKDEKEEEDENKTEESGHDAAVVVEAKDADVKPAHKKSHNILSGVGSKVKHSIAKVKKAITGKSSHSKTLS